MKKHLKEFFKYAIIPIVILSIFAVCTTIYQYLNLPSFNEIVEFAKSSYAQYGYWVVFLGAVGEGILFANWYLPGSGVVVMSVVFAKDNGMSVFWVVNCITLGFLLTAILNYALGRYGWYKLLLKFGLKDALESAKKRTEKHGLKIIFGTYFHPNLGSLIATSAGILQLSFKKFFTYSLLALLVWNAFWGALVYYTGDFILNMVTYKSLIIILIAWVVVLLFEFVRRKRKAYLRAKIGIIKVRGLIGEAFI